MIILPTLAPTHLYLVRVHREFAGTLDYFARDHPAWSRARPARQPRDVGHDEGRNRMTKQPSVAARMVGDIAPKLVELTDDVLFGDVWERPGLSKRDRSLITVAALVALYRTRELPSHLRRALANGISKDELVEVFIHLAFYAGWPSAMTAVRTTMDLLAETE